MLNLILYIMPSIRIRVNLQDEFELLSSRIESITSLLKFDL